MLAQLKKRAWEQGFARSTAMEVTQSSPTLQDPRPSPLEVPEEPVHREEPPRSPGTESSATEESLQLLRDLSKDVKQLLYSVQQLESRLSALEDRAWETQQANSIMQNPASQGSPRAVPPASSSSFASYQTVLDVSGTALSPSSASGCSDGASIEPAALSVSASNPLLHVETEERALRMLGRTSERETAHPEAEGYDLQEDTFSRGLPPIAPEDETEPQPLKRTEETSLPIITAVWSESEAAHTDAEASVQQEGLFSGESPQEDETEPQPSTSMLPAAMQREAPEGSTAVSESHPTNKRRGSLLLTYTMTPASSSSPPLAEACSPTKRRRKSMVWKHFEQLDKYTAKCEHCKEKVEIGKRNGCGRLGTGALLSHLKRKHNIPEEHKALA